MSSDEQGQERGFKVADRRRFSETGEARESDESATSESSSTENQATQPRQEAAPQVAAEAHAHPHGPIDFSTFIIGLSTQALAHLGEIPDPMHQAVRVDLDAARQVIDILGLLRDKTKGNLDNTEAALLESALYDLRMKYVERVRGS